VSDAGLITVRRLEAAMLLIGVDVGGTFTDIVFTDTEAGRTLVHKVPTTPDNPRAASLPGSSICAGFRTTARDDRSCAARGHCHVNELSSPSSSLSPDFGAGQQARLGFPDPEPPATGPCSVPRRLKLTMPGPPARTPFL